MFRYRTLLTGPQGSPWLSTLYCDGSLGTVAQDVADASSAFWEQIKVKMVNDVTITGDSVVDTLDPSTGETTDQEAVTPWTKTGSDTTDPLPWQTQGVIHWNTGTFVGGRQVRGKIFVPGLAAQQGSGGVPSSGCKTALLAAGNAYRLYDVAPCVWSRKHHQTYSIASVTVDQNWAFLASRRD
jgi:hypothetical protein